LPRPKAGSKGSAEAALQAANRAFTAEPSLSLVPDGPSGANALQGRRRLSGAFSIETHRIRPDPNQPRKNLDTEKQRELTASVRRLGILQPITVRYIEGEEIYQIIAGERRYQAAREAGLAEIPCWVQTPKNEDILLHQIVENWQRADLEPLELAEALEVLRNANGYSQKQIAELTGKPESEISRLLSLLKLDPQVQQQAQQGQPGTFTKRHLTALAQLPQEEQQEMMNVIQEKRLSAVDTERVVQEKKAQDRGEKSRGAPVARPFRFTTPKATVTITFRKRFTSTKDILAVLEDVRSQVLNGKQGHSE
jgi:ParB family chromosome partitioning protein